MNICSLVCNAFSLNSELSFPFLSEQPSHWLNVDSFKRSRTVGGAGWRCVRQGLLSAFAVIGQKIGLMRADGRNVDRREWLSKNCVRFTKAQQWGCHCFQGLFEWLCPRQLPLVYTVGQYLPKYLAHSLWYVVWRDDASVIKSYVLSKSPTRCPKVNILVPSCQVFAVLFKRDHAWNNIVTCQYCHLWMVHSGQ